MKRTGIGLVCVLALISTAYAQADLTGVWKIKGDTLNLMDAVAQKPVFTAAGQRRFEQNRTAVSKRDVGVDLIQRCSSPGMPRILLLPYPFEIVQESGYIAMLFEWNQLFRQIVIGGERDSYTLPSGMGFSQGVWDGDTLVVITTDRNETTLLDNSGLPHGAMLKLTERLQLKEAGKVLEDRLTIEDAEFYQQPWTVVLNFERQENAPLQEDVCLDRVADGRPPIETPAERRKAERKR